MKAFWKRILSVLLVGTLGVTTMGTTYKTEAEQKNVALERVIRQCTNNRAIVQVRTENKTQLSYSDCTIEDLGSGYYCIKGNQQAFRNAVTRLCSREDIVSIQPDYEYHFLQNETLTKDSASSKQWGLYNDGSYTYTDVSGDQVKSVAGIDVNVQSAWKQFQSKEEVVVAVLDTGIDYKHEDLKKVMWKNTKEIPGNGKDDDGNGYVDDIYGWDFYNNDNSVCSYNKKTGQKSVKDNDNHGTHCAGILAAVANNGVGIAGVASNVNVKLMSVKVLGGVNGGTSTSRLIKGIRYAMSNGAQIINASWGGGLNLKEDVALKNTIAHSGILFVVSAGNDGRNNDEQPCYPANYSKELDNVITVGSVESNGKLAPYSNYGSGINILAPGSNIYSTIVGGYGMSTGTSMSVPFVSGIAAMLYAGKKKTYPSVVKQVLCSSYRSLEGVPTTKVSGTGIIDAGMAIENRSKIVVDKKAPSIVRLSSDYKGKIQIEAKDEGGSGVCSILYTKGKKGKAYFRKGARGKLLLKQKVTVKKAGLYTFYVRDHAGNETISRINIVIDKTSPSVRVLKKGNKLTLCIKDSVTGLETVRFAYDKRSLYYFDKGGGKYWAMKKSGKRRLNNKEKYVSIYAADRAGNETFKIFKLK